MIKMYVTKPCAHYLKQVGHCHVVSNYEFNSVPLVCLGMWMPVHYVCAKVFHCGDCALPEVGICSELIHVLLLILLLLLYSHI